ncbi:MAG TPA: tetratricopeptide repeat protein [Chthonomonadaceae bacterium]|nr:tetratricopeptide repeat protein [Chthonomonadaceae bacterium]
MTPDIFLSYSSRDALTANALCKALEEAGNSCWIAPRNILPGQTWSEAIIDAINASKVMLLLFSSASNASPQVLREIERAINKRLGLIAFRTENVPLSKPMEYFISVTHWLDATSGPLQTHLPALVESVQALLREPGRASDPMLAPTPVSAAPPSPVLPPHNLPASLTSFVGRTKELAGIKARLASARLLTLLGAGGSGKTRLALQAAASVLPNYPEGVWLVELAPLSDANLLAQEVARVLQVKEQPGQSLLQTLTEAIGNRKLLLVLDNCEHLAEGCGQLSTRLLRACPHLRLLATSRSALNVAGKSDHRVPPLSLPPSGKTGTLPELEECEAVRLFVDRAMLTQPTFALTEGNASSVAAICLRLDGLPLALELAAARVRAMSVEQLAARLGDRFKLLTGGSKSVLAHQQTLRAMMDWSYALLGEPEKRLLGRLSVFSGGWTLEMAERVCAGEGIEGWEVLDLLFSLVDKSLVVYEEQGESARYHLLETVREYAGEKLREAGEQAGVQQRHRDGFLVLAEEIRPKLTGPEQGHWLSVLEGEHDNLRAALTFCQAEAEGGEAGLRLGAALQRFWQVRGYLSEGRERLMALLSLPGAMEKTLGHAVVFSGVGALAMGQGDYAFARAMHEQSLEIRRELTDTTGIANSLNNLGALAWMQGDYTSARPLFEESLAIRRELGDKSGIAASLNNLGLLACNQADYASARPLFEESLMICRELGDKSGIAASLNNLGLLACNQADYASARALNEESLAICRELGDKTGIGNSLHELGIVAWMQGDYTSARPLFEESLAIRRELGNKTGIANSLNRLGALAYRQGDYVSAHALYVESLDIQRELGDRWGIADVLSNLGIVVSDQGDYAAARMLYEESLGTRREMGDRSGVAESIENLASLALKEERGAHAIRLWGAASALREAIGSPLPPAEREKLEAEFAPVRKTLGEPLFTAAWEESAAMTMEQAIELALECSDGTLRG